MSLRHRLLLVGAGLFVAVAIAASATLLVTRARDAAEGDVRSLSRATGSVARLRTAYVDQELTPTGPLVGPIQATWRTAETVIGPGAKLLVYTDGLTEARDAGGTMLGEARLVKALRGEACEEARVVLKQCFAELETFAPTGLHDDVTVVVLCRTT